MLRKFAPRIVVILVFIILMIYQFNLSGYGFSPYQAVKANPNIKGDTKIIGEVDRDWVKIYILETQSGIKTAIAEKTGFMWRCLSTTYIYDDIIKIDKIKTVGCVGVTEKNAYEITVFAVQSSDPQVKYIEVGPDSDRQRKNITLNETAIFVWDKTVLNNDLNALAFNEDDQEIFKYEYNPDDKNVQDIKELRWYASADITNVANDLSTSFEEIGYKVERSQERKDILTGIRSVLHLSDKTNEVLIQIYAYPTSELASEDISRLDESGCSYSASIGSNTYISWVDTPHFYLIDNVIILYVGSNSDICDVISGICGKQVKGM